ncbi:MAG: hypothetical protein IT572_05665 [Deltaproteobacteria bacterium]|nr:hypothetical protein [Deltaproteobacteria bacterium]
MAAGKPVARHGDLEINEDISFQRKMWRAERVTRGFILTILAGGLLGAFGGGGALSVTELRSSEGGLRAEILRFGRVQQEQSLVLRFPPSPSGETRLGIESAFFEAYSLERIFPPPLRTETREGRVDFLFPAAPESWRAHLALKPKRAGMAQGRIVGQDGAVLKFRQWVYP